MKDILYRKIFKALNEDLNMTLSDDDFEEPEIDLGVHMQNIQKNINQNILKLKIQTIIQNTALSDIINNEWDRETYLYTATNNDLRDIIELSIESMGPNANLNWIDTSQVTNMTELFDGVEFNGDISGWDVSNVTNMSGMFQDSEFNGDISQWDVSNVTNMEGIFSNSKFNGDISQWDVSNVTNMNCMFWCSKFNGDISAWDVSNVTDMGGMFDNCPIKEEYKPKV